MRSALPVLLIIAALAVALPEPVVESEAREEAVLLPADPQGPEEEAVLLPADPKREDR